MQTEIFIFTEIHMQTEIPKYETYQTGFYFLKLVASPPPPPWVNLRGWTEVKIQVLGNINMLHNKLKKITHASNMWQISRGRGQFLYVSQYVTLNISEINGQYPISFL